MIKYRHAGPPFLHPAPTVRAMMLMVLVALIPVYAAMVFYFGITILVNLTLCCVAAVTTEAIAGRLKGESPSFLLLDGSALVTAALIGLTLPPGVALWMPMLASFVAVAIAKHLFGGLGRNIFNPAMFGYVILLVSFPATMTSWPAAHIDTFAPPPPATISLDAVSQSTPLFQLRTELDRGMMTQELRQQERWNTAKTPWFFINLAALAAGLLLILTGTIGWQIPAGVLAGLIVPATVLSIADPSRFLSGFEHAFLGATMLAAFFIATDPVSGATTQRGRWVFALGVGCLIFGIRTFGAHPDGVAFAILAMNALVPLIDYLTELPRTRSNTIELPK